MPLHDFRSDWYWALCHLQHAIVYSTLRILRWCRHDLHRHVAMEIKSRRGRGKGNASVAENTARDASSQGRGVATAQYTTTIHFTEPLRGTRPRVEYTMVVAPRVNKQITASNLSLLPIMRG